MEGVNNILPNSINDVLPWPIFEKFTFGLPYIPIFGTSPFNPRVSTAWHIRPESIYPHTSKYRMLHAIIDNDINEVKAVLDKGILEIDCSLEEKYGTTALTLASWFNRTAILKYLILRGATIDNFDEKGNTALMLAVKNVNYSAIGLLISYGADMRLKDKYDLNCIEKAKMRGFESLTRFLEKKASERDEIIEKAHKNQRKRAWDLPNFDIKFSFEEVLFGDEIFKQMVLEKNYYTSKPLLYPFNDLKGSYYASFLQKESA